MSTTAYDRLVARDQLRVRSALRSIRSVWCERDHFMNLTRVLQETFPNSGVMVYSRQGRERGPIAHTTPGPFSSSWEDVKNSQIIEAMLWSSP